MRKDEFLLGLVDWTEKNIVSVFPERSVSRFMAYASLPLLRDRADRMIEENRKMLEEQAIIMDDDIDLSAVESIIVPAMEKAGSVDFQLLGMKFSLKPNNLVSAMESLRGLNRA